jgi:hypothetical protein
VEMIDEKLKSKLKRENSRQKIASRGIARGG